MEAAVGSCGGHGEYEIHILSAFLIHETFGVQTQNHTYLLFTADDC